MILEKRALKIHIKDLKRWAKHHTKARQSILQLVATYERALRGKGKGRAKNQK